MATYRIAQQETNTRYFTVEANSFEEALAKHQRVESLSDGDDDLGGWEDKTVTRVDTNELKDCDDIEINVIIETPIRGLKAIVQDMESR